MSLIGKLREAEHQGREAALEGFSRAYNSLEEAQSRLRRKMRIHPGATKTTVFVSVQGKDEIATPIVSINGQDLPPEKKKERVA